MSGPSEPDGAAIEMVYEQQEPNQPIDLGAVNVEYSQKDKTYQGAARVTLSFVPDDRLCFSASLQGKGLFHGLGLLMDKEWDGKLRLVDRGVTLDVFNTGGGDEVTFVPRKSAVAVTPPHHGIVLAVLHLFNFPDFYSLDDSTSDHQTGDEPGRVQWGQVVLCADGWRITVATLPDTRDRCEALRRMGGYAITHMGRIERQDGSEFSSEDLSELLTCIHDFLSLALGRWAGVALPVGLDAAGNHVFEEWGLPRLSPGAWEGSCSWFDEHHGGMLQQVFPGFRSLWTRELWRESLRGAVYWYVQAAERGTGIGVDTGLILAQTALERLAWTYCVQERKMISAEAFQPRGGLSAADKLRLLASSLGIPLEVPPCLSALHARRGRKWQDSMDAITGIRNSMVHPHAKKTLAKGSEYEAWKLSLWYLDLVFLSLCGHVGQYANRLNARRVGHVEDVPWITDADDPG